MTSDVVAVSAHTEIVIVSFSARRSSWRGSKRPVRTRGACATPNPPAGTAPNPASRHDGRRRTTPTISNPTAYMADGSIPTAPRPPSPPGRPVGSTPSTSRHEPRRTTAPTSATTSSRAGAPHPWARSPHSQSPHGSKNYDSNTPPPRSPGSSPCLHAARRRRRRTPHPRQPRAPQASPRTASRPLPHPRRTRLGHPEQVLGTADQGRILGGPSAALLIITAAWTGCRWGELTGLQRDHVDLCHRTITIDPDTGALHESTHKLWLGPPKTPASARTITLPRFLAGLLQMHLTVTTSEFVLSSPQGHPLRRSTFDRRVFRPAVDGNPRKGTAPIRPGLTFHGLRHSHKTWLIADNIPEIAQARRLGHHLGNRLIETYSHVASEIEHRVIRRLELRWHRANQPDRPPNRRPKPPDRAPHTAPALRTTPRQPEKPHRQAEIVHREPARTRHAGGELPPDFLPLDTPRRSTTPTGNDLAEHTKALRPGQTPDRRASTKKWS